MLTSLKQWFCNRALGPAARAARLVPDREARLVLTPRSLEQTEQRPLDQAAPGKPSRLHLLTGGRDAAPPPQGGNTLVRGAARVGDT